MTLNFTLNANLYFLLIARWYSLKCKPGKNKTDYRGELEVRTSFTVKSTENKDIGSTSDLRSTKKENHKGSLSSLAKNKASNLGGSLLSLGTKVRELPIISVFVCY